ncbi:Protein of unknown function (DUF3800) [Xanthomonas bromi]|uniref:DUF3800 domain-containing protein n=1 Tax=Xanthomonas bromi TaxID=56449 RepID=A0A1C3NGT4_9XANT|nr:DUF3800 domain-containing protein [Xanthomonas bromi]PPV07772.1 DUF3800 domain-containing protein [Xanthomonas bromi]SBV49615.1 Protein of unknown function (DUF3800) [Xanthomonas bromi]
MFIYVDESGSFVPSSSSGSWSVVAAYVVPEISRKQVEGALKALKRRLGCGYRDEVKLKDVPESEFKVFLAQLREFESVLFVSGIDLGHEDTESIVRHQADQVQRVRVNRPKMLYEEGRALIDDLSGRLERLSPQLYAQLVVQVDLIDQVFRASTLYYAQRLPATLGSFRWRIDEKNSARPLFEQTLSHMASPLIQAKSLEAPGIFVEEFDYSYFEKNFRYATADVPSYVQEAAGRPIESAVNLGAVFRDSKFVRSHDFPGVQVADLLASAWRRALRGGFDANDEMASLLGSLTVQRQKSDPSIHLISLSHDQIETGTAYLAASIARRSARSMLLPRSALRRHTRRYL